MSTKKINKTITTLPLLPKANKKNNKYSQQDNDFANFIHD
jgi:hypothetical protein